MLLVVRENPTQGSVQSEFYCSDTVQFSFMFLSLFVHWSLWIRGGRLALTWLPSLYLTDWYMSDIQRRYDVPVTPLFLQRFSKSWVLTFIWLLRQWMRLWFVEEFHWYTTHSCMWCEHHEIARDLLDVPDLPDMNYAPLRNIMSQVVKWIENYRASDDHD